MTLVLLLPTVRGSLRSHAALQMEVFALRHQLQVLERSRPRRLHLTRTDRLLWVWLSRVWSKRRAALVIVKPETVIGWHRSGFRLLWSWKNRRPDRSTGRTARPPRTDSHDVGRHSAPLWLSRRLEAKSHIFGENSTPT